MLKDAAFVAIEQFLHDHIDHAEYDAGGATHQSPVHKEIRHEGNRVLVDISMDGGGALQSDITQVRLIDVNGKVFCAYEKPIAHRPDGDGLFMQFSFTVAERA